jgi:hypothetical protein
MRKIVFVLTALALTACGGRIDKPRARVGLDQGAGWPEINVCSGTQLYAAVSHDEGDEKLREAVLGLLSATIDPETIGDILDVELHLNIRFNENYEITNSSMFRLVITDSMVGQQDPETGMTYEPFQIVHMDSTLSGKWDPIERKLTLKFSDEYGEINLAAQEEGDALVGTISFENTKSWDDSAPSSGVLGTFSAKNCSLQ